MITTYFHPGEYNISLPNLVFLLMVVTFLIGTFALLIYSLFSPIQSATEAETAYVTKTNKNVFLCGRFKTKVHIVCEFQELIFHIVGGIGLLLSSIYMLVRIQDYRMIPNEYSRAHMVAGVTNGRMKKEAICHSRTNCHSTSIYLCIFGRSLAY